MFAWIASWWGLPKRVNLLSVTFDAVSDYTTYRFTNVHGRIDGIDNAWRDFARQWSDEADAIRSRLTALEQRNAEQDLQLAAARKILDDYDKRPVKKKCVPKRRKRC